MLFKTYLKLLSGCLLGIFIVDIVLLLLGLAILIGLIVGIVKKTLFFIFHPIRFFKEMDYRKEKEMHQSETLKQSTLNPFVNMLNEELAKIKKNKNKQIQNNGDFSSNNIQIGSINKKD